MISRKGLTMFGLVILWAFFLQVLFVFADTRDTPGKAVSDFMKKYYQLDASMAERLCSSVKDAGGPNYVDDYLQFVSQEASRRGFDDGFMKSTPLHLKTETLQRDGDQAVVRVTGERKRDLNPVYTVVAKLFFLGDKYSFDQTFEVVQEDGCWKVCGDLFTMYKTDAF